ncbi:beta-galactosidase [Pelagicoccus enzymogenes]|uniref:beta-galactosidase n=1 Tax=Pelagicoccus enzymogenes TaxID=2773457 RepID=UPI00280D3242|nr:beta-galactosidase [Pelagicoccus enzymogenes]MDQ8198032.1 beta-galactosidase [Pelagicoccus enzymogenes]
MHTPPKKLQYPATARTASVANLNGRPSIHIDGTPVSPLIYALTDVPSGRWSWEELPQHNIARFCERGIKLVQLDLSLQHIWKEDGSFDLSVAQRQIQGVLEACPSASVIFRFHVRAPLWWLKSHPQEWVAYADTDYVDEQSWGLLRIIEHDNNPVRRVSMASRLWREEITIQFKRFLTEFSATPESRALVGIQVANGVYGEWHNWGFFDNEPDVSEPMTQAFRDWLKNKYGNVDTLRQAWGQPDAEFSTVQTPGVEQRRTDGIFRDPKKQAAVVDFYDCMHQVTADAIIHFAQTVKEDWPRPIIVGTFYGYFFSCFGRHAAGGHLHLQRILDCDAIDYLSGPQAYEPEAIELGDPYRSRSLIDSVRMHGKLWLDEMDCEPKTPILKDSDYSERVQQSVADLRRNTAFSLTKGMGLWYYDFNVSGVDLDGYTHPLCGSQGNWDHPVLLREIERLRELQAAYAKQPHSSMADVLMVYDTKSFYYTASLKHSDPISPALLDHLTLAAFRSGVVFDTIHLDDLPQIDLSPYRVIVFGNTFALNADMRQWIQSKVACNGRHLIWNYAPGYISPQEQSASLQNVEELCGIKLKEISIDAPPTVELGDCFAEATSYTVGDSPISPLFAAEDVKAETLARFAGSDSAAIARKTFPNHTSWFVSLPSKATEPFRTLLERCGAHRYGEPDAFFYGGSGILAMHSLSGGQREIRLPNGKTISLPLPPGPATVILDGSTGEILLNEYGVDRGELVEAYPE